MGAEAIQELLQRVNIDDLAEELRLVMKTETSALKRLKAAKRLKVVDAFRRSGHRPEWMILNVIPVIPPELRPLVPLDGGRCRTGRRRLPEASAFRAGRVRGARAGRVGFCGGWCG